MSEPHANTRFGVILAGGAGERFWPLSRKDRPKQLLALAHPAESMLAQAVRRLSAVAPPERIYVITGAHLVGSIRAAGLGLPPGNIVAEPCKRNTAGALAWITAHILAEHPALEPAQVSMAVTTADHRIGDDARFQQTLLAALDAAESQGALVVCGIAPGHPETGFGYIQAGDPVKTPGGGATPVFSVQAFHEKPPIEKAEAFLAAGNYYWNSGMFFWTVGAFLEELDQARPALGAAIAAMSKALAANDADAASQRFEDLEDISIDYALMEQARHVLMVKGDFPWGDLGLWTSLEAVHETDPLGNCVVGDAVLHDTEGCIVYNDQSGGPRVIGVAGAEDLVIVATGDAVLVVPKARAQDVRHLVAELKRRHMPQV